MTTRTTLAVATLAASLCSLGAAPAAHAADDAGVKCAGINSCKGTADCKTAHNDCKGMNSCKGQGWVHKSSEGECAKAGGTVTK